MPILIIGKLDEDHIKNEVAIVLTTFSSIICQWGTKGQVILMYIVRSTEEIELVQRFIAVVFKPDSSMIL